MSVKIFFEIGHDSTLKAKPTSEGFTHDWELYVRGCDNHDISHFVEKVVFNLHDSFPKPKRVVKEAPYSVKESGYAGFVLTIDIYVKNREEPKKISFSYDLDLQQTGPTIQRKQSEKYIFINPSEEFKRKLLKGGGVLLPNTPANLDDKSKDDTKGKMSTNVVNEFSKKHKLRPEDPFTNLFGIPITKTTTKVSPDAKTKTSPNRHKLQLPGNQGSKLGGEKVAPTKEKIEKESKSKYNRYNSPHREKATDGKESRKTEEKYERREEKKKDRNHSKDRDKSKEKTVKRPASPKRSPKRASPGRNSTNNMKVEEKLQMLPVGGNEKSSKKTKKEKKEKTHEKERERKDHKKESVGAEKIAPKSINAEKSDSVKVKEVGQGPKDQNTREKNMRDVVKVVTENVTTEGPPKSQTQDKRTEKHEKDNERRHKHKKKDKSSSNKEKKKDKDGSSSSRSRDDINSTPTKTNFKGFQDGGKGHPGFGIQDGAKKTTTPLDKLYNELGDVLSSDSDMENAIAEKADLAVVMESNFNGGNKEVVPEKVEESKSTKRNREKKSSTEKKKKRKGNDVTEIGWGKTKDVPAISKMDPPAKIPKRSTEDLYKNGDVGTPNFPIDSTPSDEGSSYRTENVEGLSVSKTGNPPLSMDYMSELKDLQHKIMTLQDNNELQHVVEMIAATGQYEITSKTFDFDLCALDKGTVQRLQEFFGTS